MGRMVFLTALVLAGCSATPDSDLQYIGKARSLGAEWAVVNEQASAGRLTDTYIRTMRAAFRESLQTAAASLTRPNSNYAREIAALIDEPGGAAPAALRAHVDKLKQIEDSLESA